MKHIGHPLPGDFLYNPDYRLIGRQALHSWQLDFIHPIKKEPLHFEAPLPEDMRRLFGQETNTVPPIQRSPFG
jgi:23S rRNA pseudouridine1911/1915/1917 synthase